MRQRYSEPKRSMQISPQEFWLLSSWLPKRCCYRHRFSRGTIPWNCRRLEACALRSPETYCCRRRLAGYTEGKFRLGVHQKYRKIELSPSVGVPPAQGSGSKFDQLEVPDVESRQARAAVDRQRSGLRGNRRGRVAPIIRHVVWLLQTIRHFRN